MDLDEQAVEAFIVKFKASDNDKRVDQVQMLGLRLEDTQTLPESSLDALTLLLAPTLRSSNHLLIQSTLTSFLPFFIPHLPTTNQTHLKVAVVNFLPSLLEKLNDPKEKLATPSRTSISLLGKKCFEAEAGQAKDGSIKGKEKETLVGMWERQVKEGALGGKGWRGKVEGMKLILGLKAELGNKMTLKPWLATLVELLEDGDSNVRETARETIVSLLSAPSTPAGAKAEVKKLLQARNIRASIADSIITRIFNASAAATPISEVPPVLDDSTVGGTRSGAATPAGDEVPIVYIASAKDLESEFSKMLPPFQGRETEHNWLPREKAVIHVRGMLRGRAFEQFPGAFVAGLKAGFFEGLQKVIVSLRTTVQTQCCALMQELAEHLGSAFDPFVESTLPIMAKMSGYTKKIIADKSQRSLNAIIVHSTAHPRMFISHIHSVIQDKNVQTRTYATTHLKTFIDIHAIKHRHTIEGTSSLLETLVECTRKGLSDVNPGVREEARPAFWSFNAVWPTKGNAILAELDASQNKQLDKVRPQEVAPIAPVRPPVAAAKKSSGIGALLAEKRRAAMAARQDSQRTVSSPVPGSPLLGGGRARSTSQSAQANQVEADSPDGSPQPESKANGASAGSQPQDTPVRSKMATMTISSPRESPSRSPLYQKSSIPTSDPMSSSSSSASQALKTPTISRTSLPHEISTPEARDAQEVQAAEGVMAARQLLELTPQPQPPSTPARGPTSKTHLFPQTPVNGLGIGRNVWEDSPGPTAVTPMMVDKLKGRRHERSWWLKRQQYLDKASPFKSASPAPASAIDSDVAALMSGTPELRNLQKLTLFSTSHPVSENEDEAKKVWTEGRLFGRVFDGLLSYLRPERDAELLEHGLVLLWELVQHQWSLMEGQEAVLLDCLFTLRSSKNTTILESTNSLLSLLTEICDPVYLLGLLRASLERYIASQQPAQANGNGNGYGHDAPSTSALIGLKAQASGYLFGFNGMGMCILRLPAPVIEVEAPKLSALATRATSDTSSEMLPARQAVHHLLLCIQCNIQDSQRTLAMFPDLADTQKNLAVYLMGQNGLLPGGEGSPVKVMGLMNRGTA